MAVGFEIGMCLETSCTGLTFKDRTGFFGADTPYGYGAPGVSIPTLATDGTFGYSEYVLNLFFAQQGGYDDSGDPDFTADLLTWPHTIDTTTGVVTWEFTFEELGITDEILRSGWWKVRLDPVIWENTGGPYDYSRDQTFALTSNITSLMDAAMLKFKQSGKSACSCGGTRIQDVYQRYRIIRDFDPCSGLDADFQTGCDWLQSILPLCAC